LREAWENVGGYPEWLDYCEDLVFDFKMKRAGYPFAWAPTALARFRPRPSLTSFFRQYYRYARGDGKADLWRKRHALRYSTYLLGSVTVVASFSQPWLWLFLLAAAVAYLYRPYRRLSRQLGKLTPSHRLEAILWVPVIRLAGDIAKMLGYPVGVWWRYRNV
jgi:GT2 family glycosyltransferase